MTSVTGSTAAVSLLPSSVATSPVSGTSASTAGAWPTPSPAESSTSPSSRRALIGPGLSTHSDGKRDSVKSSRSFLFLSLRRTLVLDVPARLSSLKTVSKWSYDFCYLGRLVVSPRVRRDLSSLHVVSWLRASLLVFVCYTMC